MREVPSRKSRVRPQGLTQCLADEDLRFEVAHYHQPESRFRSCQARAPFQQYLPFRYGFQDIKFSSNGFELLIGHLYDSVVDRFSQGQAGGPRSSLASSNKEMDVDELVQDQEIPSMDFRDQRRDAEWVASVRGRPSVSTKRLRPSNRNAPIPSADDVIVYSSSPSRQPSRSRSQSKSRKRSDSSIRLTSTPISQDDQETIIKYLLERSLIEDGDEVDLETLRDG